MEGEKVLLLKYCFIGDSNQGVTFFLSFFLDFYSSLTFGYFSQHLTSYM